MVEHQGWRSLGALEPSVSFIASLARFRVDIKTSLGPAPAAFTAACPAGAVGVRNGGHASGGKPITADISSIAVNSTSSAPATCS